MIKGRLKKKLIYQISKKFMIYKHQKEVVVISTYLIKNNIEWSGIVKGCSHFHANSDRKIIYIQLTDFVIN